MLIHAGASWRSVHVYPKDNLKRLVTYYKFWIIHEGVHEQKGEKGGIFTLWIDGRYCSSLRNQTSATSATANDSNLAWNLLE